MTRTRTLQPEDQLAHYRVVGPLGSGGMGEVYLAQDQTLERNVALKVLPQELMRSAERVRRFVQEARSASSLNHPNIITIYEIGEGTVASASGEASTGSVQYISMELVNGKTLGAKIHEEKTDLRTLLGYLAQAAEGIAKAHAAGIVHRDLKPGNIMVSDDGFAKVLDFGLAKLTEQRSGEASATAMTEAGDRTAEGAVLGTVYYMSPEQVQGKSVDYRSDVFSFGCILYEAATRQRPFTADSNVETMHKILHDKPQPIEELNPTAPAELRRLIRRCLNKAPDQRLQSMKDVAIELREIVDEYDTLSASATSASTGSAEMVAVAPRRGGRVPLGAIIAGGALVVAAALFFGLRLHGGGPAGQAGALQTMRIATQTSRGNVTDCNLSADGRYIAYLVSENGKFGMYVHQVATGSDADVLPMSNRTVASPVFSPDGNYLFYLAADPENPIYNTLYRIASLGGAPERIAFDVDSRVSFSPDGTQFVFSRKYPQEQRWGILTMPVAGGKAHELASVAVPDQMSADPCWSPDGKSIVAAVFNPPPAMSSTIVAFDVATGKRTEVLSRPQTFFSGIAWLNQGRNLLITAADTRMGLKFQVFEVSYPGGEFRRITNDFNEYQDPSASVASDLIAAVRITSLANLWSVGLDGAGVPTQITRATSSESSPVDFAVDKGTVYYSMVHAKQLRLFAQPADGEEARLVSTPAGEVIQTRSGGGVMAFDLYDQGELHVWQVGSDGGNARRLAHTRSEQLLSISPDGRYVAFAAVDSGLGVWIASTDRDESHRVSRGIVKLAAPFSPDSGRILLPDARRSGGLVTIVYRAIPCEGAGDTTVVSPPPSATNVQWLPDGSGISYMDRSDPVHNVFGLRFGSETPIPVTCYTDHPINAFEFSPDGHHLVVVRQFDNASNVWVSDADGANPHELTAFPALSVFGMHWLPDSNKLVMSVGTIARDVVLISDFQQASER